MTQQTQIKAHIQMAQDVKETRPRLHLAALNKAAAIRESQDWREAAAKPLKEYV